VSERPAIQETRNRGAIVYRMGPYVATRSDRSIGALTSFKATDKVSGALLSGPSNHAYRFYGLSRCRQITNELMGN